MSFVTGGIYLNETLAVAAQHETGASWETTAARALESGAFPVRKESSARRTIREITHRLRCLNGEELEMLASGDRDDQIALIWLGICRAYRFIREFASEVLANRLAGYRTDVSYEDFDAFFARKAEWSPQLSKISDSTRAKLRAVMFRFLREAGIHLVTGADEFNPEKQAANLAAIEQAAAGADITFTWEIDRSGSIHARHIKTDNGWKIGLDRGLDIFQRFDLNDAFSLPNRLQKFRAVKPFEVTYLRLENGNRE